MARPARTTHGDYGYARTKKCQCELCLIAARRYNKMRTVRKARGVTDRYDAAPIRARLQPFLDAGISCDQIARATGGEVQHSQVRRLMFGNAQGNEVKFLYGRAARALTRVTFAEARATEGFVSTVGLRRRLEALQYMGHSLRSLADEMGITQEAVWHWLQKDTVLVSTTQKVDELYRRLSLVPGDNQRARWTAYRRDYVPAMAWDEEDIDNPDSEPDRSAIRCVVGRCHRSVYKHSLCNSHFRMIDRDIFKDGRRFRAAVQRLEKVPIHAGASLRTTLAELKEMGLSAQQAARRTGFAVSHVEKLWGDVA